MHQGISRRDLLGSIAAALSANCVAGPSWLQALAAENRDKQKPLKRVILLWMHGGPATIDLWDLKPTSPNGGPFKETQTATPGMRISEHLPRLAAQSDKMALVRCMTSKEGDHGRAVHFARTGYKPQAGIDFPDLGSLVSKEQPARIEGSLPQFVSIAPPQRGGFSGSGFLGPRFAPLHVGEQARSVGELVVKDLEPQGSIRGEDSQRQVDLLQQFNRDFVAGHAHPVAQAQQTAIERAIRMMQPEAVAAFDLQQESNRTRDQYSRTLFGQSCLLARRLVERGVSFVEVTLDGWDTHQNNFDRVRGLSNRLDAGYAALLTDLEQRGMLDSTMVLCLGEFGRTPKINDNAGRDHWPRVWSVAVAGGGITGGQLIGQTNVDGTEIESDAYTVPDLIASVCTAIGIDPMKQNMSNVDRPIRVADPEARLIKGLV